MKEWDDARDQEEEAADEDDPEAPNLENMMEEQREKLREQREKDEAWLGEFAEAMEAKNVDVIRGLKTDISAEYVFVKMLDKIRQYFIYRNDIIEKQQA